MRRVGGSLSRGKRTRSSQSATYKQIIPPFAAALVPRTFGKGSQDDMREHSLARVGPFSSYRVFRRWAEMTSVFIPAQ